jgi:hypothetical protein
MPEIDPGAVPARLITRPTPLEAAPRLARAIGLAAGDLWIKRDDLTLPLDTSWTGKLGPVSVDLATSA